MYQNRKVTVPMVILLSIVTCGIYPLIWIYKTSNDTQQFIKGRDISPGLDLLLCMFTCGLYSIYWLYRTSRELTTIQQQIGMQSTDDTVVVILLAVFGLGLISMCILQSRLNEIWDNA